MNDPSIFSSSKSFSIVDLDSADFDFARLHSSVLANNVRVELTRDGKSCVLISKVELQGLEEALEILADTESVRQMRDQIAGVAQLATQNDPAPPPNSRLGSIYLP